MEKIKAFRILGHQLQQITGCFKKYQEDRPYIIPWLYHSMTKQKRAISISSELDGAIGLLAMKHEMNYSEFIETRLREIPEMTNEIKRLRALPKDPPAMIKGDIKGFLKKSPHDMKSKKPNKIAA